MGYISSEKLQELADTMKQSSYGAYLERIVGEEEA
jgi:hypothetical protein